jgi:DNA-binding IclR family transcriptional regulator
MNGVSSSASVYRVQVLDRAVGILKVLADHPSDLAPAEIADRLSLHKSTIHRLIVVLEQHGFIRKTILTGKYGLGLKLFELGSRAVAGLDVSERAKPFLDRLVQETGETAHVCVLDGHETVSIANVEGPRTVRMPATVGRRTPAHCTAVGKAALAFLPKETLDALLAHHPLPAYTHKTLVTRRALAADLEQVRRRGYAIDDEEVEKGLRCIGAPVRNYSGDVVASLSIAGPTFRVTRKRIPALALWVVRIAQDLSTDLGYGVSGRVVAADQAPGRSRGSSLR